MDELGDRGEVVNRANRTSDEIVTPLVEGAVVHGISRTRVGRGRRTKVVTTTWSGIYRGVRASEWNGEPVHFFETGIMGVTPQRCFTISVAAVAQVRAAGAQS